MTAKPAAMLGLRGVTKIYGAGETEVIAVDHDQVALLLERHLQLPAVVGELAQEIRQVQQSGFGGVGVVMHQFGDAAQGVVEDVRIHLRLQGEGVGLAARGFQDEVALADAHPLPPGGLPLGHEPTDDHRQGKVHQGEDGTAGQEGPGRAHPHQRHPAGEAAAQQGLHPQAQQA
jgi:hypothetical protein